MSRTKSVIPAQKYDPAASIRLSRELDARIAEWRREQPDLPNRSEAIRRLVEIGLANTKHVKHRR
jgi:Arc/MetJ-type ribon-helix-helix transcriptional regulator